MKNFVICLFLSVGLYSCSLQKDGYRSVSSIEEVPRELSEVMTEQVKLEISSVVDSIFKLCPPEKCIFIGLGRSPAPFIVEMKKRTENVLTLPLSSFRYNRFEQDLSVDEVALLQKHFSNTFLDLKKFENRTVMLLDYAQSGSSLFAAQQYINDYLQENLEKFDLKSIALTTEFHDPDFRMLDPSEQLDKFDNRIKNIYEFADFYKIENYEIIQLNEQGELADLLRLQYFDDYAEYGSMLKEGWGISPHKNLKYRELREILSSKQKTTNCLTLAREIIIH